MKINKSHILSFVCLCLFAFSSCVERDLLEEEQYKKIIYLMSGDYNIFNYSHALNDSITTGYITVGSGGTLAVEKNINIRLAVDTMILYKYNRQLFDIDKEKYAQLLDPSRYVLPSKDTEIVQGDIHAVTNVPIEVDANGLSPDTVYMIPLKIVSSDSVEVNKEKSTLLYKINLMNQYSEVGKRDYSVRGIREVQGKTPSTITGIKKFIPIDKNKVRILPGNISDYSEASGMTELQFIENNTLLLVVNDDNSVKIKPYLNLQIEPVGESFYNEKKKVFYLSYRYKLQGDNKWTKIEETLTRIDPLKE